MIQPTTDLLALLPESGASHPGRDPLRAGEFRRLPRHVGFIPDGNRRWAEARGLSKSRGYEAGIEPGLALIDACASLGIEEISIYGFTKENTHRPSEQVAAFQDACVEFARRAVAEGAALLVVGDSGAPSFPSPLRAYTTRTPGRIRVNLVVHYTWSWDLGVALASSGDRRRARSRGAAAKLGSHAVSRIDLVVRWGGRRRL